MIHGTCKKWLMAVVLGTMIGEAVAQVNYVEPPVMGWSSWNTYRVHISEDLIKRQADAMVSQGLNEVGYRYVNIDDGFFGYRDEKGVLHTHPERFPNGMKVVADYIHSLGLKAGIYPEYFSEHLPVGLSGYVGQWPGTFLENQFGYKSIVGIGEIHHFQEHVSFGFCRRRSLQRYGHAGDRTRAETGGGRDTFRYVVYLEFPASDRL